jgi:hypothetical protein
MPKKRFEIEQGEPPRFQVEGSATTPKRFEVQGSSTEWFQQENASDCVPGAALNVLTRLGLPNRPRSIREIREAVASNRESSGESTMARFGDVRTTGWLGVSDLARYLSDNLNLNAELVSNALDINEAKRELRGGLRSAFILVTREHAKALRYIGPGERFELLDSFSAGPQVITTAQAFEIMDQSIGNAGIIIRV